MEKRITVAQVVGKPTGGVMSVVMNYFRFIDRDKFKFVFFTEEESRYDEEIIALGGEIKRIPSVRRFPRAVSAMKRLFSEGEYDIVHAHLSTLSVFPLYAAKKAGVRVRICHAHSTGNRRERVYIFKRLLRPFVRKYATALAGCSDYANDWLYGEDSGAFVMNNAIDTERFSFSDSDVKNVAGTIGRFEQQKNHLFLIEAFKKVAEKNPEARLYILGGGRMKKKLEAAIEKNGLDGRVTLFSERRDPEVFLDGLSLFVLPSLFEGLPLVAVEAQARGLPCILSNEITREAAVGGYVKFLPTDVEIWAEAITAALSDGCRRKKITLPDRFDIAKAAASLEKFYGERVV